MSTDTLIRPLAHSPIRPFDPSPSLYDYSPEVQSTVQRWMEIGERVKRDGPRAMEAIARETGIAVMTQYKRLGMWRKSGCRDWTVFLDRRHFSDLWEKGEMQAELPAEFVTWCAGKLLGNQRKSKPAWRAVLARWQRWRAGAEESAMPGYTICPEPGPNGKHPAGWSYANLKKRCANSKAEVAIARVGTVAARQYLPYVPGTREGARWLEWIFFDDVWLDREVIVPGRLRPVRVLQLGGLDLASGVYLKFGQRPDGEIGDDGVRERLKRRDFLFLVASLLDQYGFPADYDMHLICERGTATMSAAEARVLYDVSEGRIQVCYTSMEGTAVLAWEEGKTGNSRGKAMLESWHNLFHNEQAHLPAQVGMDRDRCPAALIGIEREAMSLQKAGVMMPEALRARLGMPIPSLAEAYRQTLEIVDRINQRTDHACEGFGDVMLWRLPGTVEWREERELARVDPEMVRRLEWRTRKESPAERMARLSHGVPIRRLPRNIWPRFYEDSHELCRVTRGWIEVTANGRKLLFGPELDGAEGTKGTAVPDGTEVVAYFEPNDPKVAHITTGRGAYSRYIGSWPRIDRVRRGDAAALAEGIRRKQVALNQAVASVRNKRAEELLREQERMAANEVVMDEWASGSTLRPAGGTTEDGRTGETVIEREGELAGALQAMGKAMAAGARERRKADAEAAEAILAAGEEPAETGGENHGAEDFLGSITEEV